MDHSHADAIVALADQDMETSKRLFTQILEKEGVKVAVVPYVMPGFGLAGAAKKVFDENKGVYVCVCVCMCVRMWCVLCLLCLCMRVSACVCE